MTANPALAAPHADTRKSLETIHLMGSALDAQRFAARRP